MTTKPELAQIMRRVLDEHDHGALGGNDLAETLAHAAYEARQVDEAGLLGLAKLIRRKSVEIPNTDPADFWSDCYEVEQEQWIDVARAVVEFQGERHEPEPEVTKCDYCGDELPSVKHRAHIPTTPDLQRRGFDADKIVCPECAKKPVAPQPSEHVNPVAISGECDKNEADSFDVSALVAEARHEESIQDKLGDGFSEGSEERAFYYEHRDRYGRLAAALEAAAAHDAEVAARQIDAPSVREAIGEVLADMEATAEGTHIASSLALLQEITDAAIRAAVSPPSRTAKRTGYETVGHGVGEHSQKITARAAEYRKSVE